MKCASVSHSVMSDSLWSLVLYSPPGSSVPGILQARILEWVAIPSSRASSWPRDRTQVSCIAGWFFTIWATRESLRNTMVTIYHQILPNTSSDSSSPWGKTYPSVTQPLLLGPMSWSQEGSWGHSWPQGLFCPMAPETALSNASSMTPPLPCLTAILEPRDCTAWITGSLSTAPLAITTRGLSSDADDQPTVASSALTFPTAFSHNPEAHTHGQMMHRRPAHRPNCFPVKSWVPKSRSSFHLSMYVCHRSDPQVPWAVLSFST